MAYELGTFGVFRGAPEVDGAFAAEVEKLGFGAIWLGRSPGGELAVVEEALDATDHLVVATGIVNIWADAPADIARAFHRIEARHPGRFLLGIGAGHREHNQDYRKPYAALVDYLDGLDAAGVPQGSRALAALGPKVVELAGKRTAGAHPYLTTPEHTRTARAQLGDGPLLVPEHKVVLDTDTERARAVARETVAFYLGLANYTNNLRKLGFTDEDLSGEGSDRLVDALVLHGDPATVAAGLRAHRDAGADQVAVHALGDDPLATLRPLAAELF